MPLWVSLLALASVSGQVATASKPVISLHPPWATAFQGESVSLTCNGSPSSSAQKTSWFRRYQGIETSHTTPGHTHEVHETGEYQCQAPGSLRSHPVDLVFSSAKLILQAPLSVFEGDSVALSCRSRVESAVSLKTLSKNGRVLAALGADSDFRIRGASLEDNGAYLCRGFEDGCCSVSSNQVKIQVQELFPRPVLRAGPARPTEGGPVTLTCETRLPPQRSDIQLQFCFFRENQALGSNCSSSPEFRIATVWREDTGSYSCQAQTVTHTVIKRSHRSQIFVQKPVAKVQIHTRPAPKLVFEGQELVLVCSVAGVPGPISISWYRRPRLVVKTESAFPPEEEFKISTVESSDAGEYYCVASNSRSSFRSKPVTINVRVPVSCPVLTLSPPGARVLEGDVVTLHCEAPRGSPPILYQFFHEGALFKQIKAISGGAKSLGFPLTAEHSGNYYCTADNGLGPQRSEAVPLSVKVPVSRPVLTLSPPGAQALDGDVVTLHCEAQRGSPHILYQFYHEDVALGSASAPAAGEARSLGLPLTAEHSGNYSCTADNGFGPQRSEAVPLSVIVPASRPVLTLRAPGTQVVPGDTVELRCEAQRGSPPILYRFYHEDVALGSSPAPSGGGASFNLSLTAEHSGNYSCEADNGLGAQRSEAVPLSITVPVSRPVLTLRAPRAPVVLGDTVELRCEAQRGSPPILYRFYHEDVALGSSSALSGGGACFNLSLTAEHSGNYSCEADNGLGAQRSEAVPLSVTVPASRPILTLRAPGAQVVPGDTVELCCEAQRGSPPILYRFYHEDVVLGSSPAPSGGGASFNLSLTAEHSGNYSCEADNGLGAQRSEAVPLSVTGLTGSRGGPVTRGVTGALLSLLGLAAGALLLYCWLPRRTGGRPASDPSSSASDSDPQEPTYHNVPAWVEMQPVYSNVNPKGGDVVYSEVRSIQKKNKHAAAATPGLLTNMDSNVIYSQVKVTPSPSSRPQHLASSAPHR